MLIDTHCHIDKESYDDPNIVIKNMQDNILVASAASPESIDEIVNLVNKYKNVYGTIGIHPEFAGTYTENDLKKIEENIQNPKIIGIGEIGLDYHYGKENIESQKKLFIKQINLANKYNKTIVIHTRDASLDTYNIIKETKKENTKLILHCFSGSLEMAKKYIEIGAKLGIGGILTFKNEKKLKQIVEELDLTNFVLETDSPYLTPEPYRGKKNEPANVKCVAMKIAEIKKIDFDEVAKTTTQNALSTFDLQNEL